MMMSILKNTSYVSHNLNGMLIQQCLSNKAKGFGTLYLAKNCFITGCPGTAETIRKALTSWYFNKSNKYEVHFGT